MYYGAKCTEQLLRRKGIFDKAEKKKEKKKNKEESYGAPIDHRSKRW